MKSTPSEFATVSCQGSGRLSHVGCWYGSGWSEKGYDDGRRATVCA